MVVGGVGSNSASFVTYLTMALARSVEASTRAMPKYTKFAPFTVRLSYSQMAVTLWTPSRDTESTTYSVPARYSITSTASLTCPRPFTCRGYGRG